MLLIVVSPMQLEYTKTGVQTIGLIRKSWLTKLAPNLSFLSTVRLRCSTPPSARRPARQRRPHARQTVVYVAPPVVREVEDDGHSNAALGQFYQMRACVAGQHQRLEAGDAPGFGPVVAAGVGIRGPIPGRPGARCFPPCVP